MGRLWHVIAGGREMDGHEDSASRYRERAAEFRAMLPKVKDELTRETLEKIASGYEQLADIHDNLAITAKAWGKL